MRKTKVASECWKELSYEVLDVCKCGSNEYETNMRTVSIESELFSGLGIKIDIGLRR